MSCYYLDVAGYPTIGYGHLSTLLTAPRACSLFDILTLAMCVATPTTTSQVD